jgi:hypothetical protein
VKAVHKFSSGTPRVINTLCDNALFEGYVARVPMIDEAMIGRVALDLGLDGGGRPAVDERAAAARKAGPAAPGAEKIKSLDLGEIDRYLAGLAKPS